MYLKGYVMNIVADKNNKHSLRRVKPRELLNIGLDPAVLWNVEPNRDIDIHIFIVATLINGYSEQIIEKLLEYFGRDIIIFSLDKYRDKVSDKLYNSVVTFLNTHRTAD